MQTTIENILLTLLLALAAGHAYYGGFIEWQMAWGV